MRTLIVALCAALALAAPAAADEPFTFVAFGDTDYEPETDDVLYQKLLAAINARRPAFSIHVGDTKGYGVCDEAFHARQRDFFNSLDAPLIYSPGNNEWSECWRPEMGGGDPVAILDIVRQVFFADNLTLGKVRMPVERQGSGEGFGATPENAMWEKNGILFVTLNLAGTSNNLVNINEKIFAEFLSRDRANEAWVQRAFSRVKGENLKGVVFAFHSSLWLGNADFRAGPFERVVNALKAGAEGTKAQVLIVNGHAHALIVDRPWQILEMESKTLRFNNITRLQVPGWPEHKAVEVRVEPDTPGFWSFKEIFDPNNLSPGFRKD